MPEELIEDILAETDSADGKTADLDPLVLNDLDVSSKEKGGAAETEALPVKAAKEEAAISNENAAEAAPTVEALAIQIGWNPNYKGEDAIDASTYILKSREIQETMKENNQELKGQLSNVQGSIEALKDHNKRVYQTDVRRMQSEIDTLRQEKRKAVELADVEKVDKLDQQIDNIQKNINAPAPKDAPATNPVYDTWVKDNQWYLNDTDMAQYAETIAQQYTGAPLERIYKIVSQKVAEVFPEKFDGQNTNVDNANLNNAGNTNQNNAKSKPIGPAGSVEAGTLGGNKPTFTKANLTPEQNAIMTQFVRQEIMTEEQYINDIAKMQEA